MRPVAEQGRGMASKKQSTRIRITLKRPEDVLAAIPYIVGFRPSDSVVLLTNVERGKEVGRRLRGDLPPEHAIEEVAHHIAETITQDEPTSALIVIVGGGDITEGADGSDGTVLPYAEFVRILRDELDARGVDQPAAYWVPEIAAGVRYRCYDHEDCTGELPDPMSSEVAAQCVSHGYVTYESRKELERLLKPDSEVLLRERADLIDAKQRELACGFPAPFSAERGVTALQDALKTARSGVLALGDDQLAELAIALTDPRVRDACLATALPPDAELATTAMRLWQALTRALPAPESAQAACLAGYAAYVAGQGPLAGIALRAALEADSTHVLAGLLLRALEHGIHPDELHRLADHDEVGLCAKARVAA
ncbi:MAG: DUF4192 family protein [Actinophytocola sp.]|nr:DUF4192 family protein [Actinophytocola sp.]